MDFTADKGCGFFQFTQLYSQFLQNQSGYYVTVRINLMSLMTNIFFPCPFTVTFICFIMALSSNSKTLLQYQHSIL